MQQQRSKQMRPHMTVTDTAAAVTSIMTHQRSHSQFLALISAGEHANSHYALTGSAPWACQQ